MNETIVASGSPTSKTISETLLAIADDADKLESLAVDAGEAGSAHLLKSVRTRAQECAFKATIEYTSDDEMDLVLGGALDELDAHARAAKLLLADSGAALASRLDLLGALVHCVMDDMQHLTDPCDEPAAV